MAPPVRPPGERERARRPWPRDGTASRPPGGWRATPLLTALLLVVLAGRGAAPSPAAAQATAVPETAGVAFVPAFRRAWASGDVRQVLPLFAPDAVVELRYRDPDGPMTYQDPDGPMTYRDGSRRGLTLRDGVAALLDAGARPDFTTAQEAPVVLGGALASGTRWTYRRPSAVSGVPPEVGADELVLRGGRILLYARTPDGANEAARMRALGRAMATRAMPSSGIPDGARPGGARGQPDTQERGAPGVGPWVLAVGVSLLAVVVLAALQRPTEGR